MIRLIIILTLAFVATNSGVEPGLHEAINRYWSATTEREKERAAEKIVSLNPLFEEVVEILKKGKRYPARPTRFIKIPQQDSRLPPRALVVIPEDYSPERRYPVQVYLHGAVSNMDPDFLYRYTVDTLSGQLLKSRSIIVFPAAWYLAPWWSEVQSNNIKQLVTWVKDNYNVDENRIHLSGVSDGGIGSYYFSNCDQTMWSSITPFIGSVRALAKVGDRQVYFNNFRNSALLVVNTKRDHIFHLDMERPYVAGIERINKDMRFIQVDSSGHSLGWYPALRDSINMFVEKNKRNPYRNRLVWQTDDITNHNRFGYLIIGKLGKTKTDGKVRDVNEVLISGINSQAFKRDEPSGIVELEKEGNVVNVKTSWVKRYTLLLSPDHFDFTKPIVIFTNGVKSFEGQVVPDVKTLLRWNIKDNDREMLFGAELTVLVN